MDSKMPKSHLEDKELRKANKKRYMNGWEEYFAMHRNRTCNPKQYGKKGPSIEDSQSSPVHRAKKWYSK